MTYIRISNMSLGFISNPLPSLRTAYGKLREQIEIEERKVGGYSRMAFIPFWTLCSRTNDSPEWMISMIADGLIASRSLRKTLACPLYAVDISVHPTHTSADLAQSTRIPAVEQGKHRDRR